MPRTKEQNEEVRKASKEIILDTALTLYVRYGYNGTDMDAVAENAGVAKGLLYYYFKTKNILFRDLFNIMILKTLEFSEDFIQQVEGFNAVEKLVKYSVGIFGMGINDTRYIQFAMRMPFDAYAVFGSEGWKKGMEGSKKHSANLEKIIAEGIKTGYMKCDNAKDGASAFWTVYVAGLFNFTRMTGSKSNKIKKVSQKEQLKKLLSFGMAGLGVKEQVWKDSLNKLVMEEKNESI